MNFGTEAKGEEEDREEEEEERFLCARSPRGLCNFFSTRSSRSTRDGLASN